MLKVSNTQKCRSVLSLYCQFRKICGIFNQYTINVPSWWTTTMIQIKVIYICFEDVY